MSTLRRGRTGLCNGKPSSHNREKKKISGKGGQSDLGKKGSDTGKDLRHYAKIGRKRRGKACKS